MKKEMNYKEMSAGAKSYMMAQLKEIYSGCASRPKFILENSRYYRYNDNDYAGIIEIFEFEMTDGSKYRLYYEHKGMNHKELVCC